MLSLVGAGLESQREEQRLNPVMVPAEPDAGLITWGVALIEHKRGCFHSRSVQ